MDTPEKKTDAMHPMLERYLTPIAVLLGALIIAFALMYSPSAADRDAATNTGPEVNVEDIAEEGEPFIGNPDAPTTLAVYYDYQCPYCQQFELQVMPRLIQEYVSTGKTRIVFKDFQFLGEDSTTAAVYARAVWEAQPEKFYPWYVAVMTAQDGEGGGEFGRSPVTAMKELTSASTARRAWWWETSSSPRSRPRTSIAPSRQRSTSSSR
jgi:hypothetical protein